jgi:catechol 2,3-dioxygenase-like lactoylglutathione lyase family enzyme
LVAFYAGLGFAAAPAERIPKRETDLLELNAGGTRIPLRLGDSFVTLDCFDQPGRGYPLETTAADLCFQHFAIVTADAEAAWTRAMDLGATAISHHGPVTLPKSSGGVTACKFRDPEGHPLEFIKFPNDSLNGRTAAGNGIDHSALSVSDLRNSQRFYEALGLSVQPATLNQGETQESLDGLARVLVDVMPMTPSGGNSHIELLSYREPVGRPAAISAANDVAATRVVWAADRDALVRDPDGHLHVLWKR